MATERSCRSDDIIDAYRNSRPRSPDYKIPPCKRPYSSAGAL
jgi:hypothetical protein